MFRLTSHSINHAPYVVDQNLSTLFDGHFLNKWFVCTTTASYWKIGSMVNSLTSIGVMNILVGCTVFSGIKALGQLPGSVTGYRSLFRIALPRWVGRAFLGLIRSRIFYRNVVHGRSRLPREPNYFSQQISSMKVFDYRCSWVICCM